VHRLARYYKNSETGWYGIIINDLGEIEGGKIREEPPTTILSPGHERVGDFAYFET